MAGDEHEKLVKEGALTGCAWLFPVCALTYRNGASQDLHPSLRTRPRSSLSPDVVRRRRLIHGTVDTILSCSRRLFRRQARFDNESVRRDVI